MFYTCISIFSTRTLLSCLWIYQEITYVVIHFGSSFNLSHSLFQKRCRKLAHLAFYTFVLKIVCKIFYPNVIIKSISPNHRCLCIFLIVANLSLRQNIVQSECFRIIYCRWLYIIGLFKVTLLYYLRFIWNAKYDSMQ